MTEPRHDHTPDAAAKDTRVAGESTLASDVLAFLAAVRDALNVPRPAPTADWDELMDRRRRRDELIVDRATSVRIAASVIVDSAHLQISLRTLTESIRLDIAAHPVNYEVQPDPAPLDGGEQA